LKIKFGGPRSHNGCLAAYVRRYPSQGPAGKSKYTETQRSKCWRALGGDDIASGRRHDNRRRKGKNPNRGQMPVKRRANRKYCTCLGRFGYKVRAVACRTLILDQSTGSAFEEEAKYKLERSTRLNPRRHGKPSSKCSYDIDRGPQPFFE